MDTVILVPTYNVRDNIVPLAARIHEVEPDCSILFIDDGSPDGTGSLADELAGSSDGRIQVLHRREKQGLGAANVHSRAGEPANPIVTGPSTVIPNSSAQGANDRRYWFRRSGLSTVILVPAGSNTGGSVTVPMRP